MNAKTHDDALRNRNHMREKFLTNLKADTSRGLNKIFIPIYTNLCHAEIRLPG